MFRRPKFLSPSRVAVAVLLLVAAPIAAWGAATIGSAQIKNDSIRSVDIKQGEVKTGDLKNNSVTSAKIPAGVVGSSEIKNRSVRLDDLAPSARPEARDITHIEYDETTDAANEAVYDKNGLRVTLGCSDAGMGEMHTFLGFEPTTDNSVAQRTFIASDEDARSVQDDDWDIGEQFTNSFTIFAIGDMYLLRPDGTTVHVEFFARGEDRCQVRMSIEAT